MESLKLKKQNTKKKLLYGRQRSLSDAHGIDIRKKDPNTMTEEEKVTWKVAIQREYEDVDEYLEARKAELKDVSNQNNQLMSDTKNMISSYNQAVDRIGQTASKKLQATNRAKPKFLEIGEEKNYMKPRNLSARGSARGNSA
mmetsp:Transcript_30036/g.22288  ORF Transcript_30036/g.22288 Transcript_30036/m.22288 type:complete len:142 (-) Transcript_30036:316-741(-)